MLLRFKYHILVAEDDELSAHVARTILERLGCVVDIAIDGAEAVEYFRNRIYSLVLMDWQMPVMDGFEATARIRAMPLGQTTPIIGTTAARERADCMKAGMNDVVSKPFEKEKLMFILEKWAGKPSSKDK